MGGSRCDRHARLGKSSKRVSDTVHTCAGAHACPCAVTPLRTQSGLLWICANVRFNWKPPDPSAVAGPWGTQQRGRGESAHHSGLSRAWRLRPPLNGFTSERPFVPPRSGFERLGKTANNLEGRIQGLQMFSTLQKSKLASWVTVYVTKAHGWNCSPEKGLCSTPGARGTHTCFSFAR